MELEALQERLISTCEKRAQVLGDQLKTVEQELEKRDLTKLPTSRLFSLADSLRRQIQRETGTVEFTCPVKQIPREEYHEQVQDWKP